jgi:hypothetical protein
MVGKPTVAGQYGLSGSNPPSNIPVKPPTSTQPCGNFKWLLASRVAIGMLVVYLACAIVLLYHSAPFKLRQYRVRDKSIGLM